MCTKYATFHLGRVYHIACLKTGKHQWDETLCREPLASQNGVAVWDTYHNGLPTPAILDQPPSDLPLCKRCANKLAKTR